jgi:hypothetical protein
MSLCTSPAGRSQSSAVAAAVAAAGWDAASISQAVAPVVAAFAAAAAISPPSFVYDGMLELQRSRARAASAAAAATAPPGHFVPGFGQASVPPATLLDSPARAAAHAGPPPFGVCGAPGCGKARYTRMCTKANGLNAGRTFLHCPLSAGNNEHNRLGFAWQDEWLEDQQRPLLPEHAEWRRKTSYKLRPQVLARLQPVAAAVSAHISPAASQTASVATPSSSRSGSQLGTTPLRPAQLPPVSIWTPSALRRSPPAAGELVAPLGEATSLPPSTPTTPLLPSKAPSHRSTP